MQVLRDNLNPILDSSLIDDFSPSFAVDLEVLADDVDELGHMNNAIYVNWADQVHLMHTFQLGISPEQIRKTGCALVVRHTDLIYLAAIREGEIACVGTCISACDGKLRLQRQFQMVETARKTTLLRGIIDYVSVDFQRGRPMRMPDYYAEALSAAAIKPVRPY